MASNKESKKPSIVESKKRKRSGEAIEPDLKSAAEGVHQSSEPTSRDTAILMDGPPNNSLSADKDINTNGQEPRDFTSTYMRNITAEFADDLDALRKASDFQANPRQAFEILVDGLKMGIDKVPIAFRVEDGIVSEKILW